MTPDTVLVNEPAAEHDCLHPHGLTSTWSRKRGRWGLSRTRFVHVFRDVVGVTPHRYVIELRTGHAARLLRGTGMPVTDICFTSGFGSVPSFHSAFRAAYGMTPSAYRAALFV